jgi:hypothetical protein
MDILGDELKQLASAGGGKLGLGAIVGIFVTPAHATFLNTFTSYSRSDGPNVGPHRPRFRTDVALASLPASTLWLVPDLDRIEGAAWLS